MKYLLVKYSEVDAFDGEPGDMTSYLENELNNADVTSELIELEEHQVPAELR